MKRFTFTIAGICTIGLLIGLLVRSTVNDDRATDANDRHTCQTLAQLTHASNYEFHLTDYNYCELVVAGKIYRVDQ